MIVSWLIAFICALCNTLIVFFQKTNSERKFGPALEAANKTDGLAKSSLITQQQDFRPNVEKITETEEIDKIDIDNNDNKNKNNNSKNSENSKNDENGTNDGKGSVRTKKDRSENLESKEDSLNNDNYNKKQEFEHHRRNSSQQTVDLDELRALENTSNPIGATVTLWEASVAIVNGFDFGLHFGLIVDMINNSHRWNLVERYLFVAISIIVFYRIVSFIIVTKYIPRYSVTKRVLSSDKAKTNLEYHRRTSLNNVQNHTKQSLLQSERNYNNSNNSGNTNHNTTTTNNNKNINNSNRRNDNGNNDRSGNNNNNNNSNKNSKCYISYGWLQLLFDLGYIIELAPWLWNWYETRIIIPEFAFFCKMRALFESFPFALLTGTYMLSIGGEYSFSSSLHVYTLVSFAVSIISMTCSVLLYDRLTLNREEERQFKMTYMFDIIHRLSMITCRIIILSFLIALFPWWVLFMVVTVPVVSYSGQYKLAQFDGEPLNVLFKAFIAFPDYSTPFGRIEPIENKTNKLTKAHIIFIFLFGFPIIFIINFAQWLIDKLFKINKKTIFDDKEHYAKYSILVYIGGRVLESVLELIFIGGEIYGSTQTKNINLIHPNAVMVNTMFWISVSLMFVFIITFVKLYNEFVVDNEEDYDLSQATTDPLQKRSSIAGPPPNVNSGTSVGANGNVTLSVDPLLSSHMRGGSADYIATNSEYNRQHYSVPIGLQSHASHGSHHSHHSHDNHSRHYSNDSMLVGGAGGMSTSYVIGGGTGIYDMLRGSRQQLRRAQFWIAIYTNNYKELAWLMRSRQHLNIKEFNEKEQLPIVILGIRHDWRSLKLMIDNGGGVRQLASYAAYHGYLDVLRFLHLKMNIDITQLDDASNELLIFSAINGNQPSVVALLAEYGANLGLPTTNNESAVIIAARKGNIDILKILVEHDIDVTICDENGDTIAHHAAFNYNGYLTFEYLASLKDEINMNSPHTVMNMRINEQINNSNNNNNNNNNNNGSNASNDSNNNSDAPSKQGTRFETGFDFNKQNRKGQTAAYNASYSGQYKNLEVLIKIGADLELATYEGDTPLIAAAMNEQPIIIEDLLSNGCNIDAVNNSNETALYYAATNGNVASLEVLIKNNANLEIADKHGNTALFNAAVNGENKTLKLLVNAGANVNVVNNEGVTPLIKLISLEEQPVYIDCIRTIIESGKCDWKFCDEDGNNAILWSCMVGEMKVFEYLVDQLGIDGEYLKTLKNKDQETCIDWIGQNREVCADGVKLLIKMGIEVPPPEQYDNDDESQSRSNTQQTRESRDDNDDVADADDE